jgi:RNA recognition motif-containing protein
LNRNAQLVVFNLDASVTNEELRLLFSDYGETLSCKLPHASLESAC